MTEQERLIVAAKASLVTAEALALPSEDPERGVEHDAMKHIARIEAALEDERRAHEAGRRANHEMRRAIVTYGDRMTILFRSFVGFAVVAADDDGVLLAKTASLAHRNTAAIRTSCTLLTNAIIESGAGAAGQPPTSPAAAAQREVTRIYVSAMARRLLTRSEAARVRVLAHVIASAGGVVSTPRCDEVAKHPEAVRELLLRGHGPVRRSPTVKP